MRILTVGNMYPPHHLGGYELVWHAWVGYARAAGHQVTVLTSIHRQERPDPAFADDPFVARALPWYWHEHRFPRLGAREVLRLEREAHRVLGHYLDPEPDIVSWWAMGGMSLSLIEDVRRRAIPELFVVQDDWPVYGPKVDRWQHAMNRPLIRRLAERFGVPVGGELGRDGAWLFLSDFMRRRLAESGLLPERSGVAHPGIDLPRFGAAESGPWRGQLVCVGRIDERKGQDVAVRALAELPDCRLRLIGSGDPAFAAELEQLASRLAVADRLEMTRIDRDMVRDAYAAADAVLFPVRWDEPWGLVPLEAMAVGRPVVATGTGGSAEYLRDGENALIYSPREDPGALAAAVRRLAAEPRLRERLRSGGAKTAPRFTEAGFNRGVTEALEALVR